MPAKSAPEEESPVVVEEVVPETPPGDDTPENNTPTDNDPGQEEGSVDPGVDLTVDPPVALPDSAITETKGLSPLPGINEGGAIDPPEVETFAEPFSEEFDEEGQLVGASNTTSSPAAYYSIFNQFTTGSNGTVQTSQYQTHIWDKGF